MIKFNQGYGLLFKNYILFLYLFSCAAIWAQPNTGQFVNYTVKDGLCESVCTGITQDSRGFYWIATQEGINRFDGRNFKSYYPSEMLGEKQLLDNSKVFSEISPNRLIVTLGNAKAFILNCISQDLTPVRSLKNRPALDFIRIDQNKIIVPSFDTVFILNNQLEVVEAVAPPLKVKSVGLHLKMLSASKWLIVSAKEYFLFDLTTKQFKTFETELPVDGLFNSGYGLLHVDTTHQWIYFLNYFKGLFQLDYSGKVIFSWGAQVSESKMPGLPNCMIADKTNPDMVWIGGDRGICHMNILSRKTILYENHPDIPFSLGANHITNFFQDRYQNLWITSLKGVSLLNKNSTLIDYWNLPISSDKPMMNLCRISKEEILAPKYFAEVFKINERNKEFEAFHPDKLKESWFVFKDGNKLIHGGKGIVLKQVDLPSDRVTELTFLKDYFKESELVVFGFRHSSGDWWFSGNQGGGLVRINPKSKKAAHFSRAKKTFSGSYFTHYSETPNGDIWFSSNKTQTLTHWIKAEDRFEELNFEHILKFQHQSVVLCITTDKKGNVWIGFDGGGLARYDVSSKKMLFFGKKQGIPSNFIYNLLFDNRGRLWVGTEKGLACLSTDLKKIQSFGVGNGFPVERFDQTSYFDEQTGMIWIASDNYLLRFYPDQLLKVEKQHLEVFIDEFWVSNKKQLLGNDLKYSFSPNQNTIQLSFSSINSSGKSRVEYSYWLEGASNYWVSLGTNSSVNFPSLPSGTYRFHLRAKIQGTKNWIYLKEPLHFTVQTPWYRSWWFKILVFIASSGLIFFVTRMYFLGKIEKQRAVLEKQRAVQNERDRIAYDMHDDLGSGLTRISYLSKEALRKQDNQQELERINAASLELVENMSELIWAMKMENDTLTDLLAYLRYYAMEYLETNQIDVQIDLDEVETDSIISGETRRHIFLIFKEALHNIVKHAQTGKVEIRIEAKETLRIQIRDFGKGLNGEESDKKFRNGMKTMQKRTQQLNGRMELSNAAPGLKLEFEFPLS
ncbi:sensor histidine kinase [Fluviicola sp.]|uniref:ligand-binding sensor domain-containing protein n=1 Tax=Fluviicola sp. TaxID=1917219 RepID=UPI002612C402|nr:sensor histidine kinase [Fluviicola sp.]